MVINFITRKHLQAVLAHAGPSCITVGSFMILARIFSKEDLGQWALYLVVLTFVDMIKSGIVKP